MYPLHKNPLGIYEKALPTDMTWAERLAAAEELGFDFVEMSIDEADHRLARLDWTLQERQDFVKTVMGSPLRVPTMCLSGHRRYPLGHTDDKIRNEGLLIMEKAIQLAADLGIRTIQLAGYDIYYGVGSAETRARFLDGLKASVAMAAKAHVMLSMEIMDYPLMNSITRYLSFKNEIDSPWFTVYPDLGNLSAWSNDVDQELINGFDQITGIHLKDTYAVTGEKQGQFRDVPFGEGCVDFESFFDLMGEIGYQGTYLIEMWYHEGDDWKARINEAKAYLAAEAQKGGVVLC